MKKEYKRTFDALKSQRQLDEEVLIKEIKKKEYLEQRRSPLPVLSMAIVLLLCITGGIYMVISRISDRPEEAANATSSSEVITKIETEPEETATVPVISFFEAMDLIDLQEFNSDDIYCTHGNHVHDMSESLLNFMKVYANISYQNAYDQAWAFVSPETLQYWKQRSELPVLNETYFHLERLVYEDDSYAVVEYVSRGWYHCAELLRTEEGWYVQNDIGCRLWHTAFSEKDDIVRREIYQRVVEHMNEMIPITEEMILSAEAAAKETLLDPITSILFADQLTVDEQEAFLKKTEVYYDEELCNAELVEMLLRSYDWSFVKGTRYFVLHIRNAGTEPLILSPMEGYEVDVFNGNSTERRVLLTVNESSECHISETHFNPVFFNRNIENDAFFTKTSAESENSYLYEIYDHTGRLPADVMQKMNELIFSMYLSDEAMDKLSEDVKEAIQEMNTLELKTDRNRNRFIVVGAPYCDDELVICIVNRQLNSKEGYGSDSANHVVILKKEENGDEWKVEKTITLKDDFLWDTDKLIQIYHELIPYYNKIYESIDLSEEEIENMKNTVIHVIAEGAAMTGLWTEEEKETLSEFTEIEVISEPMTIFVNCINDYFGGNLTFDQKLCCIGIRAAEEIPDELKEKYNMLFGENMFYYRVAIKDGECDIAFFNNGFAEFCGTDKY